MNTPTALFVAPSAYVLGGLASWLDYLLPHLRERGWNATLGLVHGPRYHLPDRYVAIHPDTNWIGIHCLTGTQKGRLLALRKVIDRLRPGLVISVNIPDAIVAASENHPTRNRPRTLLTCHGIQQDLFADMKLFSSVLDGVVCTNRLSCRLAHELGQIGDDRIFYAPYGTVGTDINTVPLNQSFTMAFVGRLEQAQKRVFDLPDILQRVVSAGHKVRLLIAGTGPEEMKLRHEFDCRGLAAHVEFLGHVDSAEMPSRVYSRANALLVTSHWETGPIVAWEAMSHGVPLVSSAYIGSGAEATLIDRVNCLLFPIGDIQAAAANIEELLISQSLRSELRKNGKETFLRRCMIVDSVDGWHHAMLSTMQRQPAGEFVLKANPETGRLTRIFGSKIAEQIRSWTGRKPPDSGPGGEWPHTLSGDILEDSVFWDMASAMDRRNSDPVIASLRNASSC